MTTGLILAAQLILAPRLALNLDAKRNSTLTIISTVPWTLQRSGDLKKWETLTAGQPAAPGTVQIFTGIDYVWGHRADRQFYRVLPRPDLTLTK